MSLLSHSHARPAVAGAVRWRRCSHAQRLLIGDECLCWRALDAARLDLGEHERASVERDQVDLAVARADVARDAMKPSRRKWARLRPRRAAQLTASPAISAEREVAGSGHRLT